MRLLRILAPLGMIALWVIALAGFYHVVQAHRAQPTLNPFAVVGYAAALIALAGWMVQAWVAIRNSQKQHTMNVLLQVRMSQVCQDHLETIRSLFPHQKTIDWITLNNKRHIKQMESVKWLLNYYEFVANGIRHGDLHEKLMRDCISSQFLAFCKRADDVIKHAREENALGRASPDKERILKSLRWLEGRWRRRLLRWRIRNACLYGAGFGAILFIGFMPLTDMPHSGLLRLIVSATIFLLSGAALFAFVAAIRNLGTG